MDAFDCKFLVDATTSDVCQKYCVFAIDKIEYLGNFVSAKGVETDPNKIITIQY